METPDTWLELIKQLGVLAVLAWFLYYTTKFVIPDLHSRHRKEVLDIISEHKDTIETLTTRFDNRLVEERQMWQTELSAERTHRMNEISQLTSAIEKIMDRTYRN